MFIIASAVYHIHDGKESTLCNMFNNKKLDFKEAVFSSSIPEDKRLCKVCNFKSIVKTKLPKLDSIWLYKNKLEWLSKPIVGPDYIPSIDCSAAPIKMD